MFLSPVYRPTHTVEPTVSNCENGLARSALLYVYVRVRTRARVCVYAAARSAASDLNFAVGKFDR